MNQGIAYEMADLWMRAQKNVMDARALQSEFAHALAQLIPDDDVAAAAATHGEDPKLAILIGSRLFIASPSTQPDGTVTKCEAITLVPERVRLSVTQDWQAGTEGPVGVGCVRRLWAVVIEKARTITILGLDRKTGFDKGLDAGEHLGRGIAAALGWTMGTGEV